MRYVKISDGTVWPHPCVDTDNSDPTVAWMARYEPESLTRQDLMQLASIANAYDYLLLTANRSKRDLVARDMRALLKSEFEGVQHV